MADVGLHFADADRTTFFTMVPRSVIVSSPRPAVWESAANKRSYLGLFGADRNGNGVFDTGPLPTGCACARPRSPRSTSTTGDSSPRRGTEMRARGFSLIEVMIATALGASLCAGVFAAMRVASQAVTTIHRLSIENSLLRESMASAFEEVDFWTSASSRPRTRSAPTRRCRGRSCSTTIASIRCRSRPPTSPTRTRARCSRTRTAGGSACIARARRRSSSPAAPASRRASAISTKRPSKAMARTSAPPSSSRSCAAILLWYRVEWNRAVGYNAQYQYLNGNSFRPNLSSAPNQASYAGQSVDGDIPNSRQFGGTFPYIQRLRAEPADW